MSVVKLSMSFDPRLVDRVRADAEQEGESLSGWFAAAAEERLKLQESRAALAEWEAEAGPVTAEEQAAVDALWSKATARLAAADDAARSS